MSAAPPKRKKDAPHLSMPKIDASLVGGMGPTKKLKIAQPVEPPSESNKVVNTTAKPVPSSAIPPMLPVSQSVAKQKGVEDSDRKQPLLDHKQQYATVVIPKMVALLNVFFSRPQLEFEASLGKWRNGKFVSGVTKEDFVRIHDMLYSYKGWSNCSPVDPNGQGASNGQVGPGVEHWSSMFDYMLPNQVRCTKTSKGNHFIRKSLVENATFVCSNRAYDVRFSLKEEVPVEVKVPGTPHLVRVKKRKSFVYKGKLQFDLTMVWTGRDEQDAHTQDPTYEVEIECVDKRALGVDHEYTSASIMEKLLDLLGRDADAPIFSHT